MFSNMNCLEEVLFPFGCISPSINWFTIYVESHAFTGPAVDLEARSAVLFGSRIRSRELCGAQFPLVPMGVFDGAWYAVRRYQCLGY